MADEEYIHMLSVLTLARDPFRAEARHHLGNLDDAQFAMLTNIANSHHVVLRAFATGLSTEGTDRFGVLLSSERKRAQTATSRLHEVCQALEEKPRVDFDASPIDTLRSPAS